MRSFTKLFVLLIFFLVCESSINAQSRPWPVPSDKLNAKNIVSVDATTIKNGRTLYLSYCAPCHGNSGKGDGAAAAALNPKPANHTSSAIQAEAEGSLFYKISEGRTPMPSYKATLTDVQRWTLVAYIKSLGKK